MLTFSDLLTYTLVLIEVITLVVILSDKKTKKYPPQPGQFGQLFFNSLIYKG